MSERKPSSLAPLQIFVRREDPRRLRFEVHSAALGLHSKDFGSVPLEGDAKIHAQEDLGRRVDGLSDLATQGERGQESARQQLSILAIGLYRKLPKEFRELLWAQQGQLEAVQILSDEPYIPWELLKLQGEAGEEGPFLCEAFQVTRWLREARQDSTELPLRRIAFVGPSGSDLPNAVGEKNDLLALFGPDRLVPIVPTLAEVTQALLARDYDGWHFTGHGLARAVDPNAAAFWLGEHEPLTPESLGAAKANLTRWQPLLFLNGCNTGRGGFSLTGLGGWAQQSLAAGAGAFLGTLWPVRDQKARVFARTFYQRFLGGEMIGEAVRQARLKVREDFPGDPAWLAYTVYAHPGVVCSTASGKPAKRDPQPALLALPELERRPVRVRLDPVLDESPRDRVLDLWRRKLDYLQEQQALISDPAQKFTIMMAIEEAQKEIEDRRFVQEEAYSHLPELLFASSIPPFEANPAAARFFVGRDAELAQLEGALLGAAPRPVALVGMFGVGKSYLVDHFALRHREKFPGGFLRLALDPEHPLALKFWLDYIANHLQVATAPAGNLVERVRTRLAVPRSLLHVENVDGDAAGGVARELARCLSGCPLVVSGRLQSFGTAAGGDWEHVEIRLLDESDACKQLDQELENRGNYVSASDRQLLVNEVSFLPLAIHLAAGYLRIGHSVAEFLDALGAEPDLEPADPADLVLGTRKERVLIASTVRVSLALLEKQLGPARAHILAGLHELGSASVLDFDEIRGAELAGLLAADFQVLVRHAGRLSLLERFEKGASGRTWRVHPFVSTVLRLEAGKSGEGRALQRLINAVISPLETGSGSPRRRQGF